jgi:hypothetical protein
VVAACADLIIASINAAPPDVAVVLAAQLLLPSLHKLDGVVLAVGQAAPSKHLSRYCMLLQALLGKGEQTAVTGCCCNTVWLARRVLVSLYLSVRLQCKHAEPGAYTVCIDVAHIAANPHRQRHT